MAEKRLGRGLGSLLSGSSSRESLRGTTQLSGTTQEIPIDSVYPNRRQPRRTFDLESIAELAASMASAGLISPIVVTADSNGRYELIAGERRWRAACQLGWETIRAQVREPTTDRDRLELALIENVQREDLNAIERAIAFHQLMQDFDLTHEQVAQRVGKSRSTLTNLLRLLELSEDLQDLVRDGVLSAGHARALLAISDPEERKKMAELVQLEGLSVRALEDHVRRWQEQASRAQEPRKPRIDHRPPQVREMEQRIARELGTKVRIRPRGEAGRIAIDYFSLDDFDRILGLIRAGTDSRGRTGNL